MLPKRAGDPALGQSLQPSPPVSDYETHSLTLCLLGFPQSA